MRFSLTFTPCSFRQMRFNIGFTPGTRRRSCRSAAHQRLTMRARRSLKINATGQNRARIGDVVNRNAVSVYQTDAVLILIDGVQRRRSGARRPTGETVQSTSMFRKISLALLAGASCLGVGLHQAAAIEAAPARRTHRDLRRSIRAAAAAPVRTAYAERSNMGGGFIEFLFGDGPQQASATSSSRLSAAAILRCSASAAAADEPQQ